ncbi:MAG TPA: hypothetical protein VFK54_09215 [Candidatus Limnocylindrales bacterium]|nr:hypothetical protein [Candidatus Limnocylindrales bacterium]
MLGTAAGGAALLGRAPEQPPVPEVAKADNGWIAYAAGSEDPRDPNGDRDIWFVGLDQEPRRVLGTDGDTVDQFCPAFSPDGRRLAYAREVRRSGASALAIADVSRDGQVNDRLAIPLADGSPPACAIWSPDGAYVAFGVPRTSPFNPTATAEGSEVWIVRVDDQDVTVLPNLLATDLEWSPDGQVLAIASGEDERRSGDALQDGRINLYQLATGEIQSFDETLGTYWLTWSPDAHSIAYAAFDTAPASAREDLLVLRVIDVYTREQRQLAGPYQAMHGIGPVWSPSGETIVYQRGCTTRVLLPCGGEGQETVLVDGRGDSGAAEVSERIVATFRTQADDTDRYMSPYRVVWSPDGKYLLVVAWGDPGVTGFKTLMVATPMNRALPSILVYEGHYDDPDALSVYDGYDRAVWVPTQTWARASE